MIRTGSDRKVICRDVCFDSLRGLSASIMTERELVSLVQEKRFLQEILRLPEFTNPVTVEQVEFIEQRDNQVTIFRFRVPLRPMPQSHEHLEAYRKLHNDLILIQKDYEHHQVLDTRLDHVEIQWQIERKVVFGSFRVPDRLSIKYEGFIRIFHEATGWEAKGLHVFSRDNLIKVRLRGPQQPPSGNGLYKTEIIPNLTVLNRQEEALEKLGTLNPFLRNAILSHGVKFVPQRQTERPFEARALPMHTLSFQTMNQSQKDAIVTAINDPLTIIQGPPGTGKTTVATYIIKYKLGHSPNIKILACAPSNVAADNVAERLHLIGVNVVRMMAKSNPETLVPHLTMQSFIRRLPDEGYYSRLKAMQIKLDNGEHLPSVKEAEYRTLLAKAEQEIITRADVVCCTCSAVADGRLTPFQFKFVLIDEATQSVEPETLCALMLGVEQLVLVGDQKQLGPTVIIPELESMGYGLSLYERLLSLNHPYIMLNQQYRMHPCIAEFSSMKYYPEGLASMVSADDRTERQFSDIWLDPLNPVMFVEVYDHEESSKSGVSYLNRFEYVAIEHFLRRLRDGGCKAEDIGVITFYDGQVRECKRRLEHLGSEIDPFFKQIEVKSVDGFQGREKKYIILSCVRSNASVGIGFVDDERRLNVALTRSQYGLIVIGNSSVLVQSLVWRDLVSYYENKDLITPYHEYKERRTPPPSSGAFPDSRTQGRFTAYAPSPKPGAHKTPSAQSAPRPHPQPVQLTPPQAGLRPPPQPVQLPPTQPILRPSPQPVQLPPTQPVVRPPPQPVQLPPPQAILRPPPQPVQLPPPQPVQRPPPQPPSVSNPSYRNDDLPVPETARPPSREFHPDSASKPSQAVDVEAFLLNLNISSQPTSESTPKPPAKSPADNAPTPPEPIDPRFQKFAPLFSDQTKRLP
jgi:regulator of nonsense transcripts 1